MSSDEWFGWVCVAFTIVTIVSVVIWGVTR